MKRLLILAIALLLLSGCVGQKTVKIGDNVSVDYAGSTNNGNVFDTSIENVAKQYNLSQEREYKPLRFTIGKGQVIEGFDEGVIGMKVGESKKLTIPPEKAYGPKNPQLVQTFPIIQNISTTRIFPKVLEIPIVQFDEIFGPDHKIGDTVTIPETNMNLTVQSITTSNVSLTYNLAVGYKILQSRAPWNDTVIKIDDKNITTQFDIKKGEIVQFQDVPWNTTIINIDSNNITMRHNTIPDTKIQTALGLINVHFNETYITMDRNNELAGETLIFDVTVKSID